MRQGLYVEASWVLRLRHKASEDFEPTLIIDVWSMSYLLHVVGLAMPASSGKQT